MESKLIYEKSDSYSKFLLNIKNNIEKELKNKKIETIGYIDYLLSGYKTDRWILREAYPQLHANLNKAIELGIKCLYYRHNSYSPAEDRALYYSFTLDNINERYGIIMAELYKQDIFSLKDYYRREKIFNKLFLPMIDN